MAGRTHHLIQWLRNPSNGWQQTTKEFNFGDLSTFGDVFLTNIKNAHDAGVLLACGTDAVDL